MSGHQTATIEDTVYFWFAANDTLGSGGDGATPLFDVREAGAAAGAIPLLSGTPTLLSHANFPAGCHEIAVAATIANGFVADDTFAVYCTLAIDSQNPTGFVGSCTLTPLAKQSQLDNLANVGSATNTSATTYVLTTGTQSSGTFANTAALDGTNHEHTSAAGVMDLYYEFNIGGGTPSSVKVTGYLNGNNDDLEVYGYDWIAPGWVQIGILAGKPSATNEVDEYDLFTSMVGVGANRGLVRIRFTDGAFTLTSATLAIDQIFVSYSASSAGYDGFIWFDSNASNTNTVSNVDGTSGNPVSSEAAVVTLSANLNINRIKVLPGSTYTLASTYNNYFFDGDGIWTLALGGQDVGGTTFNGAAVSGTGTGASEVLFEDCDIGNITIHPCHLHSCALVGTMTFGAAGDYQIGDSHSGVAGSSTPIIDTGAAIANVNLTMPNYSQGIEIRNLNAAGTDLFSISGQGQIIYAASSSGAVNQRGDWKVTNTGGVTITADDNTSNIGTIRFNGVVSIDTANGTSGTAFPTGTRNQPVDNIADALTIATAEGLDRFELRGTITLAAAFTNKTLKGIDDNASVDISGQDVSGTVFDGCDMQGTCDTITSPVMITNGIMHTNGVDAFSGMVNNTRFRGPLTLATGHTSVVGCNCDLVDDLYTTSAVVFIKAPVANTDVSVSGWTGSLLFHGQSNQSTLKADIELDDARLYLFANNGTFNVRGYGEFTDATSLAATLNRAGLFESKEQSFVVADGTIYINSAIGEGDDTNPGTFALPVKTESAARTRANNLGIGQYHIRGAISLTQDYLQWSFVGDGSLFNNVVNIEGFEVDQCRFENITVAGDAAQTSGGLATNGSVVECIGCDLDDPGNLRGNFRSCAVLNRFRSNLPIAAASNFVSCYSRIEESVTTVYAPVSQYQEGFDSSTWAFGDGIDSEQLSQSFTGNGEKLSVARFYLQGDSGVTTGTLTAYLYAHSGTFGTSSVPTGAALATSTNTVDPTTLVAAPETEWVDFQFDGTYTLVDGTKYCIVLEYAGRTGGGWVNWIGDGTFLLHEGNFASNYAPWSAFSDFDGIFFVGSTVSTDGRPVFDFESSAVDHDVQLSNYTCGFNVANMTQGFFQATLVGGTADIKSTVTGGVVTLEGLGVAVDSSGGATVTDNLHNAGGVWTDTMTEAYPADGVSAVTPAQMLYSINQMLSEFARTGTTISVKKRDGSEAFQITLDDASQPTTATQSS